MGINIGLIAKVLTVFDRDASGEVSLDQWLNILGEDVEMEQIQMPTKINKEKKTKAVNNTSKLDKTIDKKDKQSQISKPSQISLGDKNNINKQK